MRKLAAAAVLTALSGVALAGTASADPASHSTTLDTVNMEAVIKAAMWDPYKSGQGITDGSGPSVKAVESALAAKGMLAKSYVDGHFGTTTVSAYAKYQRSLGYEGLAASGLPGTTSLTKLGEGRYTVTRTISVGAKTTMDGETVNKRTAAMIKAAEGLADDGFTITQGSYTSGNSGSAGTHDGGGAVDLSVHGLSSVNGAVKALRQVGFAAWHRTADQGDWAPHIHAVAISDTDMSPAAQAQVGDYFEGRNGLADNGKDDGPQVKKVTWEQYQRG